MRAVVIIPARYGSTRFPGKALAELDGRPLICHVASQAVKAKDISEVIVATDDERIVRAVVKEGFRAVMTSPRHPSGTDRVAEAAAALDADLVVNVQGDEPLLNPEMIEEALAPFKSEPDLPMSTLKYPLTEISDYENPNVVKVVTDVNDYALYFSRAPIPFIRDGKGKLPPEGIYGHVGLYIYRKDFLLSFTKLKPTPLEEKEKLEQLRALEHGYRIKAASSAHRSLGVDTPEDLARVARLMSKGPHRPD